MVVTSYTCKDFLQEVAATVELRYPHIETEAEVKIEGEKSAYGDILMNGVGMSVRVKCKGLYREGYWIRIDGKCKVRGILDRKRSVARTAELLVKGLEEATIKANEEEAREQRRKKQQENERRIKQDLDNDDVHVSGSWCLERNQVTITWSGYIPASADVSDEAVRELAAILAEAKTKMKEWSERNTGGN